MSTFSVDMESILQQSESIKQDIVTAAIVCREEPDVSSVLCGAFNLIVTLETKLAAYKATGLTPEEITRVLDEHGRGTTLRTSCAERLEIVADISTDRLRELAMADKEGRCLICDKEQTRVPVYSIVASGCDADNGDFPDDYVLGSYTSMARAQEEMEKAIAEKKKSLDARYDHEERRTDFWEMSMDGYTASLFTRLEILPSELNLED